MGDGRGGDDRGDGDRGGGDRDRGGERRGHDPGCGGGAAADHDLPPVVPHAVAEAASVAAGAAADPGSFECALTTMRMTQTLKQFRLKG